MIYDVVIIGAGAAGLFAGIQLDKNVKKIILEKTKRPGMKVLLSGGERANVSNMDIEPTRDYFSQNRKFLISVFSKYNQWDIMSFFAESGINIVEEDRGRLILESGNSTELLDSLLNTLSKNNCEIKINSEVAKIEKIGDVYMVMTAAGNKYSAKNVIVSSGGKSFYQVGTTGDGYNFAKDLGINIIKPHPCLCGLSTKNDLGELSGVSCSPKLELRDTKRDKVVYEETGPILFTHFGVSGPIIHNTSVISGEYLNSIKDVDSESYMRDNLVLQITFDLENTPKRIMKFFELTPDTLETQIALQGFRSWKEAKATSGGVDTAELDHTMQSKQYPGLYFIGEVVDITGKTGGFNLQRAWSSGFVAADAINKKMSL